MITRAHLARCGESTGEKARKAEEVPDGLFSVVRIDGDIRLELPACGQRDGPGARRGCCADAQHLFGTIGEAVGIV